MKMSHKLLSKAVFIKILICIFIISIPAIHIYDSIISDFIFTAEISSDDIRVRERFNVSLFYDVGDGVDFDNHLLGERLGSGASVGMSPNVFNSLVSLRIDLNGVSQGQSLTLETFEISKPLSRSVSVSFSDIIYQDAPINDMYIELAENGAPVIITGMDPFFFIMIDEMREAADSVRMRTGATLLLSAGAVASLIVLVMPPKIYKKVWNKLIYFFEFISKRIKYFPSFCRNMLSRICKKNDYEKVVLVAFIIALFASVPILFISTNETYTGNPNMIRTVVAPNAISGGDEMVFNVDLIREIDDYFSVIGWMVKLGEDIINADTSVLLRNSESGEFIQMNTDIVLTPGVTALFSSRFGFVDNDQSGMNATINRIFLENGREYDIYFWYKSDGNSILVPTGRILSTIPEALTIVTPNDEMADGDSDIKFDIIHIEHVGSILYVRGLVKRDGDVMELADSSVLLRDSYTGDFILMDTDVTLSSDIAEEGGIVAQLDGLLLENDRIYSVYFWCRSGDDSILISADKHISMGFTTFTATELVVDVQEYKKDEAEGGDTD
ncbi:MAG: hypothetical protein FWC13_00640 [Oscillospiraceae bacterium]|nr:hypothetical protein [Oscillospiraceae bacterium]